MNEVFTGSWITVGPNTDAMTQVEALLATLGLEKDRIHEISIRPVREGLIIEVTEVVR